MLKNIKEVKMDTGEGTFKMAENAKALAELKEAYPDHGGVFKVGEQVELKGSIFRIKSIKPTELRLKLVSKKKGIV